VRFTALTVKSLFLRTLDLGIFDLGETSELRYGEPVQRRA
jgi:hypothetical protein